MFLFIVVDIGAYWKFLVGPIFRISNGAPTLLIGNCNTVNRRRSRKTYKERKKDPEMDTENVKMQIYKTCNQANNCCADSL